MANPFDGIITSDLKALFNSGIDEIIENLSRPCRLIMGDTLFVPCDNCLINIQTGRSANIYNGTGSIPFTTGSICPYCNGKGLIGQEATENVDLIVLWNYKDWINVPTTIQVADGMVQTISKTSDTLLKIKQSKEVIFNTRLESAVKHRFGRLGEPNPIGFGDDTYISTMWKRI